MRCDYIPARELPVRRPPINLHARPVALSATECDALLRAATATSPRHELGVRLGLDAGLRLGEAFRARAEDVRDRTLRVPQGKNHRPRTVPIPAPLIAAVEAVEPLEGGYLVRRPEWTTETPLSRWLAQAWPEGLPYHFHRLRHTWASRLANGEDPATPWELMVWGGWRTMAMVTRYYHAPETIRRGPVDGLYDRPHSGEESPSD